MAEIKFLPGVVKDDAAVAVRQYNNTDKIRFVRGQPQTIGGRELASTDVLVGLCRGMHSWSNNDDDQYIAMGTSERLYAMDDDGTVTDITPVYQRYTVSSAFTTAILLLVLLRQTHTILLHLLWQPLRPRAAALLKSPHLSHQGLRIQLVVMGTELAVGEMAVMVHRQPP